MKTNTNPVQIASTNPIYRLEQAVNDIKANKLLAIDVKKAGEGTLVDYLGTVQALVSEINKHEKKVRKFVKDTYAPEVYGSRTVEGKFYQANLSLYQRSREKFLTALKKLIARYRKGEASQDVLALRIAAKKRPTS